MLYNVIQGILIIIGIEESILIKKKELIKKKDSLVVPLSKRQYNNYFLESINR